MYKNVRFFQFRESHSQCASIDFQSETELKFGFTYMFKAIRAQAGHERLSISKSAQTPEFQKGTGLRVTLVILIAPLSEFISSQS
jgi:hypothetical protein